MLEIQKILQEKGLEKVVKNYSLLLKEYPTKVLLKYDQIKSKDHKANPAVRQCRGIILEKETWNVLSLPFVRFYNLGEKEADSLDWDSTMVQEKVDGSLMALYWDFTQDKWCVQTSGTAEADTPVPFVIYGHSFAEVFWIAAKNHNFDLDFVNKIFNKDFIYVFELQSPYNRVVVKHSEPKLTVLTIRNQKTLQELFYNEITEHLNTIKLNVAQPDTRLFSSFKSVEEIVEFVNKRDGWKFEGVVLVDKFFNRIKIKSKEYVEYSLLNDQLNSISKGNPKTVLSLILKGEQDEFLALFPEHTDIIKMYEQKLNKVKVKIQKAQIFIFNHFKIKSDKDHKYIVRKTYALYVKEELKKRKLNFAFGLFMGVLDGKGFDIDQFFLDFNIQNLAKIVADEN